MKLTLDEFNGLIRDYYYLVENNLFESEEELTNELTMLILTFKNKYSYKREDAFNRNLHKMIEDYMTKLEDKDNMRKKAEIDDTRYNSQFEFISYTIDNIVEDKIFVNEIVEAMSGEFRFSDKVIDLFVLYRTTDMTVKEIAREYKYNRKKLTRYFRHITNNIIRYLRKNNLVEFSYNGKYKGLL